MQIGAREVDQLPRVVRFVYCNIFYIRKVEVIEKNKISCVRLRLSSTKDTEIINTTLLIKKLLWLKL